MRTAAWTGDPIMNRNRHGAHRHFARHPALEPLEGRALLSALNLPASVQPGLIQRIEQPGIKTVPAGVAAILSALSGGAGSEFVALIRKQVPNPLVLVRQFETGARTEAHIHGVAVRVATILSTFTGDHYDYQAAVAAGAVLRRKHVLELGAILRGPNRSPAPAYYVFGIDRGSGASLGPRFPERPGITPDALVTITAGTNDANPSGTITDLRTGAVSTISPSAILFQGSTLRVFVDPAQLPSTGFPLSKYRFDFWVQSQLNGDFGTVGSFLPDMTEIPIGVEG
jgi:hypothetical protein